MTFYVENETDTVFDFSVDDTIRLVIEEALKTEKCPYEAQINILLTDDAGIQEYNRQYREIDRSTDVLSFPNLDFEAPGCFEGLEEKAEDYFDLDSGELLLGDIIISVDHVKQQAVSYGHSKRREFAFLVAHSMLHLCGYDHMNPDEASMMENKQNAVLESIGITRDI